jgi:hypothetical protein
MSNNQQKTNPDREQINEGRIIPPPVQRPRTDNPKTNDDEK